jgi:hypothetical protein
VLCHFVDSATGLFNMARRAVDLRIAGSWIVDLAMFNAKGYSGLVCGLPA